MANEFHSASQHGFQSRSQIACASTSNHRTCELSRKECSHTVEFCTILHTSDEIGCLLVVMVMFIVRIQKGIHIDDRIHHPSDRSG